MVSWHVITKAEYESAVGSLSLDHDAIYFIEDTSEIYRGYVSFTHAVIPYDTEPADPIPNRIYLNKNTKEFRTFVDGAWVSSSDYMASIISNTLDEANSTAPITGKAVADYLAAHTITAAEIQAMFAS